MKKIGKTFKQKIRKLNALNILNILLVILMILNINIFAITGSVNTPNIRVRKEANTTSEILGNLYLKDSVEILGKKGEWYQIKIHTGHVGYMKAEFIDVKGDATSIKELENSNTEKTEKTELKKPSIEENKVENKSEKTEEIKEEKIELEITNEQELRTLPVIYALKLEKLQANQKVTKISEKGNWVKVKTGNNKQGWILKTFIK